MYNRLIDYINENKLLYKLQFGFQKGRDTSMALLMLVDKISEALDKGELAIGVFLDFSKAFDTVDHDILMNKLDIYGIKGIPNKWFKNYLTNRTQYVTYNSVKSDSLSIKCGVPQGSILGPLLFLLYINDLSTVSNVLFSILFADDSNMFIIGKNINEMCNKMNIALKEIEEWLYSNKLSLNVLKTNYMIFTTKNKVVDDIGLFMCNTAIHRVYVTKFLGVQIDAKLTFKNHIEYTCKKLSKCVAILAKTRKKLKKSCLITLYYSFAYPHFTYCNQVWGSNYKTSLEKMFLIQKKMIRIITSSPYRAHTEPLFIANYLLDLYDINDYMVSLFMYKNITPEIPTLFSSFFRKNNSMHNHNTRISDDLYVPIAKSNARKFSIRIKGAVTWNAIPYTIRNSLSLNIFKQALKKHLIQRKVSVPV